MSVTKKQKESVLSLIGQISTENILSILGQEEGFQTVAIKYYEVVAEEAQRLETEAILFDMDGQTGKAAHLREVSDTLQILAAKLELVAIPRPPETKAETDSQTIIDTNSGFSLPDILFAFMATYGVSQTLSAMITVAQQMSDNYNENKAFIHLAGKHQQLKLSLQSARDRYQACTGETSAEVLKRWLEEEEADLAAQQEIRAIQQGDVVCVYTTLP